MSRCNTPAVYRQYQKGRHSFFSWELSSREGNLAIAMSSKYGTAKVSQFSKTWAINLLKKYGAFTSSKGILKGMYVPKLVTKAEYRRARPLKGICQYPLAKSITVMYFATAKPFHAFFYIGQGGKLRSYIRI
ncbi:hypothetical protein AVEN_183962-1 [Araneus ventricosus]|uniref:Uncharacterized protein n=1 Tax=Araneus ventricosus TaxID=182803 RepID=A0A4Y2E3B6_ARAVE|nr:hypothetical protein AVEN_183962-1 [Araneus ventricosus]